jgi:hypothetical protein
MIDRVLADLVLLVHLAFIAFVVLGGLLALRWRWAPWLHVPAAGWGAWIELSGGLCPLTPLENALRQAAGTEGYAGGFIEHYLLSVLYPAGLTQEFQVVLGGLVVLTNGVVYAWVWRRRGRTRGAFGPGVVRKKRAT